MVIQYPDTMVYTTMGESVFDQESGQWSEPTSTKTELKCRLTPNRSGKVISKVDGTVYDYSFDVCFPVGTNPIEIGVECECFDMSGLIIIKQPLLNFHIGQLHNRGWL